MSWLSDVEDDGEYSEYDESSVRQRPNPKGNKPRTKTRPEHKDSQTGRVYAVDRGRFSVLTGEGTPEERTLTATKARELPRGSIVTGDFVDLVGDTTGDEGSLARIVSVQERSSLLRRSADDTDSVERIIVANADQMLIVVAAANPEPRPRLVDRYLVAAYDAGITPILCLTKTDLQDPEEFLANFAGLELRVVRSTSLDFPLDELRALLDHHTTVAVGHSGVGKSTLVNALVPEAKRATGRVNDVTGRGRHTSSSTVSYRLDSGWIVDTPGVRSFGLGHVDPDNILRSFGDLARIAEECPRGCTHLPDAPDCAINEAAERGELGAIGMLRLDSLQRLLTTLA
ncbi:ribosome small subunit-dependent GTPase A [Galbitalea soli]|uniref:Small ribosomal subunit biogenesis GTPase RsgA n=1 Tax=Galbitalea soli TaxID=1268042 RepID=A0A7C9TQS5_9MICO|nr:ribosome small subunit-dependent GTPase A [Galbitalea soli]NEM90523.1 ribosome small subunit-dependent GTPase A [Galbitalea soli]NYJ31236.1 ribosome biogenesis GTPase [Galbitalea soli]